MSQFNEKYKSDPRSSREIIQLYRSEIEDDDSSTSLATVHYRSSQEEFDLGLEYCQSEDRWDRATGADVLAQLDWEKKAFYKETVDVLLSLLSDENTEVLYCATVGLGHRHDARAIPDLLKLVDHESEDVRYGVVHGLSRYEDPGAIAALITLSKDSDEDIRNWAIFGLGSQIETDTPEIRQALFEALDEPHDEARGEALVGLAERGDERVVSALLEEWQLDSVGILSLEAAELIADPRLNETLIDLQKSLNLDDDARMEAQLERSLKACAQK
ncbi:lyase containing HEAT-repeat [Lentisphaera araneosa HTCC2155]|uniref:Lyase containing HEAT-repeat n=1 Tax=Lentisphaera araneosa HTCC2155 TaxID=313628 RepID=A6DQ85_9BACT|nr:HEAT repeat domain-containing protein [Lentisphaera araneosa]EDM26136.1 lyase containing HEAT-repeat [Lentisphaera araneosa HTCC2155]